MARVRFSSPLKIVARAVAPVQGTSTLIAAAGGHQAVRTPLKTSVQFTASLFESYGSGLFNPYYSDIGAYVMCCTGGHRHQETFGAVLYDFTDRRWVSIPAVGAVERNTAVPFSATNGMPWAEMKDAAATGNIVPAPTHPFKNLALVSPARGGGPNGSMIYVGRGSICVEANRISVSHKLDLSTGIWTRASSGPMAYEPGVEAITIYDEVTNRYYVFPRALNDKSRLNYLDGNDWTYKQTEKFPWPKPGITPSGYEKPTLYSYAVRYDAGGKRYGIHFHGLRVQIIDLDNWSAGFKELTVTGTPYPDFQNAWAYHEDHGVFYYRMNWNAGQALKRLTPPSGDPLSGTWKIEDIVIGGDPIPEHDSYNTMAPGYRSLFYIPKLKSLGWVTQYGVSLIAP